MDFRHSARRGVPSVCRLRCGSDNKTREDPGNLQQQDKGLPRGTLRSATCRKIKVLYHMLINDWFALILHLI